MNPKKFTLDNGIRLLVTPMPTLESVTVTVWVKVGSRDEDPLVAGISHFLEHMVFKGGEKYKTAQAVSEAIDSLGAENNAATSKDWTNFYINCRAHVMPQAIEILADTVLTPHLSEKDMSMELGVILQEMKMYDDMPMARIGEYFDQVLYANTTLGSDIIGTKDSLKSIKRHDFITFRDQFYHPENIIVTVAGGIDVDTTLKLVESHLASVQRQENSIRKYNVVSKTGPEVKLVNKKSEQSHFVIGFAGLPYHDSRKYSLDILGTILGEGMSSRLFNEVREKRGLAYSVRSGADYYSDTGSFGTYAGVDPKNAAEALKVILSEHEAIASQLKPITETELRKAKEYMKGHLALSLESTKAVNSFFGYDELMLGNTTTPEEEYQKIDAVTLDEMYALAKEIFNPSNAKLAIIGPFDDSHLFEKVLQSH